MKRVLIVAYFFPPVSNMGSHRIARFVKHLPAYGWDPVVLTGASAGWVQTDRQLVEGLPPILVERVPSVDLTELWKKWVRRDAAADRSGSPSALRPLGTQSFTTFLNRWVMVPDKYFPWRRPAARAGIALARRLKADVIYSTSDPVTDHLVARRIREATGLPWVAEFRDLWLGNPYYSRSQPTGLHRAWHARLERRVVTACTLVVGLSTGIVDYFRRTYPGKPAELLYNCFDPADYPVVEPLADRLQFLYAGALYSSRSPEPFFRGLAEFVKARRISPDVLELVVIGGSPDLDLAVMSRECGVAEYVKLVGRVPHREALERMARATVLLAVQSPDDQIHVPGKLFEYMGARRPILLMAQPCEVATIVQENNLGWVVAPEATAVAAQLAAIYDEWRARGPVALAKTGAARFSVAATSARLAEILAMAEAVA